MTSRLNALKDVRVLDFSRVLAGPFCTMMLADWGADVIKVENPADGDETRRWGPPWVGDPELGLSAYFVAVNRNKRSVALNLKSAAGVELARRLTGHCDVVVENFRPGVADRLGIGYDDLRRVRPDLVYCSISGFGRSGEDRQRPGYDSVIQAMSGLMSITGPTRSEPSKVGVAISDVLAGLFATSSILAALHPARVSGRGQHLDVPLLDCQIAALVNVASNHLVSGVEAERFGNRHPNIVPYQTFATSDGHFMLAVGNNHQFQRLCRLIGHGEWAKDARFSTNPARVRHRDRLCSKLERVFLQASTADWVDRLNRERVPAGPINTVGTALADPALSTRDLIAEVDGPAQTAFRTILNPIGFTGSEQLPGRPPPLHGQHTEAVLEHLLELSRSELEQLQEDAVV